MMITCTLEEHEDHQPEKAAAASEEKSKTKGHAVCRHCGNEAESASRSDPANENLKTKVDELKGKMKDIETRLTGAMGLYR